MFGPKYGLTFMVGAWIAPGSIGSSLKSITQSQSHCSALLPFRLAQREGCFVFPGKEYSNSNLSLILLVLDYVLCHTEPEHDPKIQHFCEVKEPPFSKYSKYSKFIRPVLRVFFDVILDLIMALVKVEEMGGDPGVLGRRLSVENRAADIFDMLDVDNDGELTMEEFVDGYLRYLMHIKCAKSGRWNHTTF